MRAFTFSVAASAAAIVAASAFAAAPNFGPWGFDLTARNTNVKAGDDFFDFAIGAWLARTEIPDDQSSVSSGRDVFNSTQDQLRALIEASAKSSAPAARQIGGLYKSFMDEAAVETLDAKPLMADLAKIAAAPDKTALTALMAKTHGG